MSHPIRYCTDLKDVPGKPKCCDSCHDDVLDDLMETYDAMDRLTHLTCCRVHDWLEKRGDTTV